MADKHYGTVKFFDQKKGYGFIVPEGGGDVFVHITSLKESGLDGLEKGDEVEFEIVESKGKTKAINIELTA